jgi:LysR family transcriptional regulator, low CO2-responsive transcriptional regulator
MKEPLDSWQLRAFVTLARTGSYTQTAKELFLTHSAISHSMRALERDAGCRLLTKMAKKITLTEAGEALLRHAERVVREMEQARETLKNLGRWGFQRLRLAGDTAFCQRFVPPVLADLQRRAPRLVAHLSLSTTSGAMLELEAGQVDFVLGEEPERSGHFDFVPMISEKLHVVVRRDHAWAETGRAPKAELGKEPCVLLDKAALMRRVLDEALGREGVVLNAAVETGNLDAIRAMVKCGVGIAVLPRWVVKEELEQGSLVALPLGRIQVTQKWGITFHHERPLSHFEDQFLRLCQGV